VSVLAGGKGGNGSRPRPGPEKAALGLLVLLVVSSLFFLVHPWFNTVYYDAAMYVSTARSIAEGQGYTYFEPFHLRPPGFSVIISPVLTIAGTNFRAINGLVSLMGAAGVVLFFLFYRRRLGWLLAVLLALIIWFNPGYQKFCNCVLSDVPGVMLLIACLLFERRSRGSTSWKPQLLLGLLIGVATLVRTINGLLLPAMLASLLAHSILDRDPGSIRLKDGGRRLLFIMLGVGMLLGPWMLRNHLVVPPPPAELTQNYTYATAMLHRDGGDPESPLYTVGEILHRFPKRIRFIAAVAGSRMKNTDLNDKRWAMAFLLLAGSLYVLVRRHEPAEFFIFGGLLVLSFYFVLLDRLVLPFFILALAALVEAVRDILGRLPGGRFAAVPLALVMALLFMNDFQPRHDWDRVEEDFRTLENQCAAVETCLEPDARLGTGHNWMYSVLLERPVASLFFRMHRQGDDVLAVEGVIDKYDLNTIVLSPARGIDRKLIPYFQEHYPATMRMAGQLHVFRVRP